MPLSQIRKVILQFVDAVLMKGPLKPLSQSCHRMEIHLDLKHLVMKIREHTVLT